MFASAVLPTFVAPIIEVPLGAHRCGVGRYATTAHSTSHYTAGELPEFASSRRRPGIVLEGFPRRVYPLARYSRMGDNAYTCVSSFEVEPPWLGGPPHL